MNIVQSPSLTALIQRLEQHGFTHFESKLESGRIEKACVKTDWESMMYRVRVGSFETSLCVFKFAVGEKNYVPVAIARGQFGKVSYMKYRDEEFAFKNIRLRENSAESLEMALCEVFMMKLASCLEVGPHFRSIQGYDAVIFEDCLQVGMEFCKTDYGEEEVEQYRSSRNLF